ncbi:YbjN domain-containing protein [Corynebacterium propinquum]|uniref:YbjN domain-containing protein n=1 Tax=Corynebacterium propinquum TaxID=43769 RepID=UPI0020C08FAD|nr:YbjN domain-containing protein [Corynebacterium propinquum]UQV59359.1 YbjN domain-containing protein [Corynebacterium propinquum]
MSQQPTPNEQDRSPETVGDIAEVTFERIGEILDAEKLVYRNEEREIPDGSTLQVVRTGFSNAAIAISVRQNMLIVDSLWRGQLSTSQAVDVLAVVNSWNQAQFAPTLRFFEQGENLLAISAVREADVSTGMTRNQLGAFLLSTLDAVLESFQALGKQFPDAVTWEENHTHDEQN